MLGKGRYLISLLDSLRRETVHAGSVLVSGTRAFPQTTACVPVRYQPPRDGSSYIGIPPIHDCRFKVTIEGAVDETARLEEQVDVPDYEVYTSPDYPPTRVDGGISLETLERQCMLLFPTTLLPGCAGIPSMVSYSASFCERAVARVTAQTSDVREQIRLLAGTLVSEGAVWVDERSDDTAAAELKLCRGDDCDGLSISARALLRCVGRHSATPVGRLLRRSQIFLVAGTADLGGRPQAHMWVSVTPPGGPIYGTTINCECTAARADESHFRFSAYRWSCSSCWVFVGPDNKIGVGKSSLDSLRESAPRRLPASSKLRHVLSRAFYHVVGEPYSDRVYSL